MVGLTVSSVTDTETGALLEYSVGQASFGASLTIKLPEKYRKTYVCTICTCGTVLLVLGRNDCNYFMEIEIHYNLVISRRLALNVIAVVA